MKKYIDLVEQRPNEFVTERGAFERLVGNMPDKVNLSS